MSINKYEYGVEIHVALRRGRGTHFRRIARPRRMIGGGNPVASSKGTTYFNDMLGTTVGAKSGATYTAAALSAFGEDLSNSSVQPSTSDLQPFFTGKPAVEGLGYAFLMRNYRAGLAKWQTADPMGYPDGWNQLAYCGNGVTGSVDLWGCVDINLFPESEAIHGYAAEFNLRNVFTVAGHGTENGLYGWTVSRIAAEIRSIAKFDGKITVWLLSCYVGKGAYAQQLANELRVDVCAADALVCFGPHGQFRGIYEADPADSSLPDKTREGHWLRFKPE